MPTKNYINDSQRLEIKENNTFNQNHPKKPIIKNTIHNPPIPKQPTIILILY